MLTEDRFRTADGLYPRYGDIVEIDGMQDALEDGLDEQEYTYAAWSQEAAAHAILKDDAALDEFVEAFVTERRFDLAALLDMDADDHEAVTVALDSALTLFRCRTCQVGGLGAHELLGHKCIEERKTILADGVDRSLAHAQGHQD